MISLYSVWIPVLAAWWHKDQLEKALRMLGLFLVWGFVIDIKYFYDFTQPIKPFLIALFSLSEVLFYLWFIRAITREMQLPTWRNPLMILACVTWIVSYGNVFFFSQSEPQFALHDVFSAILFTFIASYALLQMTKSEVPLNQRYEFWLLLGIFMYFMPSVFIFSFVTDIELREKIWFLHCFFDMTKNAFFSMAVFVMARPR